MKDVNNNAALKAFVQEHKLMDSYSNIHFTAIVTIQTTKNRMSDEMEVRITFDGYDNAGQLTVIKHGIDPNQYPEQFDAKWQTFENIPNQLLVITGFHSKNPNIGNYEVRIVPV